ncbi:Ankyrin repeat [Dillenia turbinata]|uniref:Ankyrin repeat n=1 Tax=Dillenia turbinata TaxID=194707 RepID=A0AAN8ZT97_9MAGN
MSPPSSVNHSTPNANQTHRTRSSNRRLLYLQIFKKFSRNFSDPKGLILIRIWLRFRLRSEGAQQSKDELLYQGVSYGNIEGIKALRREGAGLERIGREGKTPLILACMNPELLNVAKTLIDLGANPNAYRPANPLLMNDDCQTALDVARAKGFSIVVRAIEISVT